MGSRKGLMSPKWDRSGFLLVSLSSNPRKGSPPKRSSPAETEHPIRSALRHKVFVKSHAYDCNEGLVRVSYIAITYMDFTTIISSPA